LLSFLRAGPGFDRLSFARLGFDPSTGSDSKLENFLVCGDAVYAFNLAYGQGMSVAAMVSMKLDNHLRQQQGEPPGVRGGERAGRWRRAHGYRWQR
jgi:hypothetical protein